MNWRTFLLQESASRASSIERPGQTGTRVESVDLLRGLIMVIMAIDHTRDFFTSAQVDPGDPVHSWPALFATRWITHLCAPGFVALAGLSVYLQRQKGKSPRQLTKFLLGRGLWLATFDLVGFGWIVSFSIPPALTMGPLWVSGLSMIALTLLLPLSPKIVGLVGGLILVLHNLLDPIRATRFGGGAIVWQLLHQQSIFETHGVTIAVIYPLLPWIGIMAVGYSLGPLLALNPERRQRMSAIAGLVLLFAFCGLRGFHGYGEPRPYVPGSSGSHTVMSFLDLTKYPPSLQYVLATGGVLLLLFATLDAVTTSGQLPRFRAWLDVYGRVPFFFYSLHLLVLHSAAVTLTAAEHLDWRQWFQPLAVFTHRIPGWGFGLPGVYCVWALVLFLTYRPCRWFAHVKATRREWWLGYL